MKNLSKTIWLLLLFLLVFTAISAQTKPAGFVSSDGAFGLDLPELPDKDELLEGSEAFDAGIGRSYTWKSARVTYLIQYIKTNPFEKPPTAAQKTAILDDIQKRSLNSLAGQSSMTQEKNILFNGSPGREIIAIFRAGKMIFKTYFIEKKIYRLIAAIYDTSVENEVIAKLNSFRLLSKDEIVAQKLKETVIAPLPQTPVAEKLKSDAEDENLKGKVKSVVADLQESPTAKRERFSEVYFNEQGNRFRSVWYNNGYPVDITVWGYIDGNRVQDFVMVDYNGDEFEMVQTLTTEELETSTEQKPSDDRYTYKMKYRYDKGNLVEEWMYFNTGNLYMRHVYNFKGNTKESITYDEDGKLNRRIVEIFDKNGNVIEDAQFDHKGKLSARTVHTYEFDARGNWIVQKDFEKSTVKGKSVLKPSSVTYRTITYYD